LRALLPAGLAALFVVVIGNLGEIAVLADRARGVIPVDWWYWNASRVISHPLEEPGPINEFPAFTYLFADLHAHAMALPFTATALGLATAYVAARPGDGRLTAVARFVLLALVIGALWATNAWDVPTYAALAVVAVTLGSWAAYGRLGRSGLVRVMAFAVALLATAYVMFLPFHDHYRSPFTGFERWPGSRTSLLDYLTMHGFFLFLIFGALVADLLLARDLGATARLLRLFLRTRRPRRLVSLHRRLVRPSSAYIASAALALAAWVAAVGLAVLGELVAALNLALMALAAILLPRRPRVGTSSVRQGLWGMTLALVICGLLLTVAVEYFVIQDIDVGRNNTVFKTYLQVWVLWALAAAASVPVVYEALAQAGPRLRVVWQGCFLVLFTATLLYPVLATRAKIDHRFDTSVGPTLDGMAFMTQAVHSDRGQDMPLKHDLEAIRWMLENVDGSPVIAEVNTYPRLYGWGNRFAMFTGNPAIVGWDYHERQQRSIGIPNAVPEAVPDRVAAVQEAYRTRDPERAYRILSRFGVEYLVVGPLERAYFPRGQAKWAAREGVLWTLAYRNEGVEIYRLRPQP
jgi:YYY domain-containing protein